MDAGDFMWEHGMEKNSWIFERAREMRAEKARSKLEEATQSGLKRSTDFWSMAAHPGGASEPADPAKAIDVDEGPSL